MHLLEDKQISSVRVFDESKNFTFLRVRLSLNSCIIWLDFTQSRFFSHFRYFGGENLKISSFGRFWSEKGRKTTKTQKTLKCTYGDDVTDTTWRRHKQENEEVKIFRRDRPELFPSLIGDVVTKGRQRWKEAAWRRQEGHHITLIAAVTPSQPGLTQSAQIFYIYPTNFMYFREDQETNFVENLRDKP